MQVRKLINLVEARAALSRLVRDVAKGREVIAITQRSKLAAVLVNAEQYAADMAELEQYRRQRQKDPSVALSSLMEVVGDLEEGSERLAEDYHTALRRSGDVLADALRD